MFQQLPPPKPARFKKRRLFYAVGGLLLIAIAVTALIIAHFRQPHQPIASKKPVTTAQSKLFSFDVSKAPEWHQGPTDQASTVVFYNKADCFVEIDQQTTAINLSNQDAKDLAAMQSQGNLNVTDTAVAMQLSTNTNPISYTLHQYRSNGGQSSYYQFQDSGYIPNDKGYLAISAYCKNGTDLNATLDALRAIRLKLQQ